jgi:hypothetical protein
MDSRHLEISDGQLGFRSIEEVFGYQKASRLVSLEKAQSVQEMMDALTIQGVDRTSRLSKS